MSLSLIQGYSSGEEEEEEDQPHIHDSDSDDQDDADYNSTEPSAASHPSLGDRSIIPTWPLLHIQSLTPHALFFSCI